jgi:hypothetical protein
MWVLFAGALAVLVNWIRVFIVILAGHLTHMQHYLVRESHYGFGWALFSLVIVALLIADRRLPHAEQPEARQASSTTRGEFRWAWAALLASLLAVPSAMNLVIRQRLAASSADPWMSHGLEVAACEIEPRASAWRPIQRAADHERRTGYTCGGAQLEWYSAWYREQLPGKKLGGYDNHLEGSGRIIDSSVETVGERRLRALRLEQDGAQTMLWIWYRVGERECRSITAGSPCAGSIRRCRWRWRCTLPACRTARPPALRWRP